MTEDIKTLLDKADKAEDVAGSPWRWKAAEAISIALKTGISQRKLAEVIGKSQFFVSTYARTWDQFGGEITDFTASFSEAITSIRSSVKTKQDVETAEWQKTDGYKRIKEVTDKTDKNNREPGPFELVVLLNKAESPIKKTFKTCQGLKLSDDSISLLLDEIAQLEAQLAQLRALLSNTEDMDDALANLLNEGVAE